MLSLGHALVRNSLEEREHRFQSIEDVAYERKVYIDGLTYLLKALPPSLDAGEVEQIRYALPAGVLGSQMGPEAGELSQQSQTRSIVHRSVQLFVFSLICMVHFVLPYLVFVMRLGARAERKYRVSEKIAAYGARVTSTIGQRGVHAAELICRMNDGQVGRMLLETALWVLDGIVRGAADGVDEGLTVINGQKPMGSTSSESI